MIKIALSNLAVSASPPQRARSSPHSLVLSTALQDVRSEPGLEKRDTGKVRGCNDVQSLNLAGLLTDCSTPSHRST